MAQSRPSPWQQELDDLAHGVGGAFLFGAPLLYTMEVWWRGNITSPPRMLAALALTYLALVVLDAASGFRAERVTSPTRMLADSAEALALGLITAAASLVLLRRITTDVGLEAAMGRIILESIPFSLGVGIANGLLRARDGNGEGGGQGAANSEGEPRPSWRGTLIDVGATILGATIVAFSIAPTDEVPMIAAALTGPWLLAVILASLALTYVIVFEANFGAQGTQQRPRGLFQSPLSETVLHYLVSLLMAAFMLWLFQTSEPGDPPRQWMSYIVVLGLPAAIGGAAGRLLI